jgi:dGTPase
VLLLDQPVEAPGTLEGVVVSVSDAIAYISHDLDDALRAGLITEHDLPEDAVRVLGETTSNRIDRMVVGVIEGSGDGKLDISSEVRVAMNTLRNYLYGQIYPCAAIEQEIRKARNVAREVYFHLLSQPVAEILDGDPADTLEQRTVDFVAGMTDEYVLEMFKDLFLPAPWKR